MIAITVDVQAAEALRVLHNADRRIGYAIVNALNATAKEIQAAERENVRRRMNVRKPEFIAREVAKLDRFGIARVSTGRYQVEIYVGQKPRLLLSKLEEGGERTGFVGRNVAIPLTGGARRTKRSGIDPALTFSAMKLREYRGGKKLTRKARGRHVREFTPFAEYGRLGGHVLSPDTHAKGSYWKGAAHTYLIPGVGVAQRVGPGKTRLIWSFRHSVRLPAQLHFIETAKRIAPRFEQHLKAQVADAFNHVLGKLLNTRR